MSWNTHDLSRRSHKSSIIIRYHVRRSLKGRPVPYDEKKLHGASFTDLHLFYMYIIFQFNSFTFSYIVYFVTILKPRPSNP